jgi:DnaJ-class molecular chaperone
MHHSALMIALGWVTDEEPDPTPAPLAIRCHECGGLGETQCTITTGPHSWSYGWEPCASCHGQGKVSTAA